MNKVIIMYDVPEFAKLLGISIHKVRGDIFKKKIEIIRIGRRIKIPHSEIERIIEEGRQPRI